MKEETSPSQDEEVKEEGQTAEMEDETVESAVEPAVEPEVEPEASEEERHWTKPEAAIKEEPKPSRHIGRWILILLLTLVIGFGAAFFVLAYPAQQELRQVKADLADTQQKLTDAEARLETINADLEAAESEIAAVQYALALAKVQSNVAIARSSLLSRDLLTARQEVSAASTNLEELLPYVKDQDIRDALSDRMEGIEKAMSTDTAKALDELRLLSENLLRLEEQP